MVLFDWELDSIPAVHDGSCHLRGSGRTGGSGLAAPVAMFAGVARIRAPGGQTLRDQDENEASEECNSPRIL
jgi:hypothetical protein